jgi:hypothetical protein
VNATRPLNTIDAMTTTPDDKDWLRLAEEAFTSDRSEDEAAQEKLEQQAQWRYRRPLA